MAPTQKLLWLAIMLTVATAYPQLKKFTEQNVDKEPVFVQSKAPGSKSIERKDSHKVPERIQEFYTSHKIPDSLTFLVKNDPSQEGNEANQIGKKVTKRATKKHAPAPAGAIRLDVKALLERYKDDLKTSTTQAPKTTKKTGSRAKTNQRNKTNNRRVKKEATTSVPVLTTGKASAKAEIDDIPLTASGSEKQRSRIQIKKGPNGQEYEYEYVYYYYDDEDESKEKAPSTPAEEITNAHDGPAKNQSEKKPESNEVVPAKPRTRGKTRGRELEDETVNEERLPANTRFPPRGRNLNTTPSSEETSEEISSKPPRIRRPTKQSEQSAETDNVTDETQGSSRGRTRPNVKRPSLELVDSASFNTNFNGASVGGPSFPSELPAGPVRFLGATPNESVNLSQAQSVEQNSIPERPTENYLNEVSPQRINAMDKVALDLYAISQGTQNMLEDTNQSSEDESEEITTELEITTTTTTTTTTTPKPTTTTTTTTTPKPTEGSLFGRRPGYRGRPTKKVQPTESNQVTEATKPKSKFGASRPSFGGNRRTNTRTTTESHIEDTKESGKTKPTTRSRFGSSGRTRTRTTSQPQESNQEVSSTSKPSLRPRPTFNIRGRSRPTPAPSTTAEVSSEENESPSSTTPKSRRVHVGSGNVRPLRPGPRLNLATRNRPTSTEISVHEVTEDIEKIEEEPKEPESPESSNPLTRLRNKNRAIGNRNAAPKTAATAASSPVQVRKPNPLLSRKRQGLKPEITSTEAPEASSTETASTDLEGSEEEGEEKVVSSSTTEEPRGLSKLLAGRRRMTANLKNLNH